MKSLVPSARTVVAQRPPRSVTPALLVVLGLLSAVAPFATDLYLPSFPDMTVDLDTSATLVQLTLTSFLVGVTVGQLVFGPLSDRLGRLAPLVAGAAVCVTASVLAITAPTIEVLIGARFLQGLGGAAGMVIGRAIISDLATGRPAARAFSLMMIVGGVAPVVAPLIGGLLSTAIGWRGLLTIVLGLAVVMLLAVIVVVRETHGRDSRAVRRAERNSLSPSWNDLGSRAFIGYSLAFAFAFAAMMGYISASPFIYQDIVGLSSLGYGIAFGVNALALMVTSVVSTTLVNRFSVRRVLGGGLLAMAAAAVIFAILVIVEAPAVSLVAPLFLLVAALGFVLGNATALALGVVSRVAGTGSAVLGAVQFGLAAVVSPLVSIDGSGSAGPLAIVLIASIALAMVSFAFGRGRV